MSLLSNWALFGAGAVAACLLSSAAAQPLSPSSSSAAEATVTLPFSAIAKQPVPTDPALRTGVLANGLRYALLRPAKATGAVSIRLGFDVGSYEESEAERGMAHFVEHQAFRSTRNFPNNTVEAAFAAEGLTFGRDHNAGTDLFSTSYMIDLNRSEPGGLARAFTWLRDVADGIVFEPASVEKERGVVLAEKQERDSASQITGDAVRRFRMPGLRFADRSPIGTDAVLRGATPAALEAFYRRWYRPENAIVVVVSELPAEVVLAQLESAFGSWRAVGVAPPRAPMGAPDTKRPLDVFTRADGSGFTSVDVCRLQPAKRDPRQDYAASREGALELIWQDVFNQRMVQRRQVAANQLLGAEVDSWTDNRNVSATCLSIKPTNDAWGPALAAGQAELARFEAQGPTELEVERAIDRVRARLRGAVGEAANRSAATLADGVLETLLERATFPEPRQVLRAYDLAVEDVTAADVHAAFKADWGGSGPLISVVAPKAPTTAEVRSAWVAQAANGPGAAYADVSAVSRWGYGDAPAGIVAARETVGTGGFSRIRFRNGVVLNFKRTTFAQSKAVLMVRFGSGRRQVDNRDLVAATLGGSTLPFGGLGKHGYDDIREIMRVDLRDLVLRMEPEGFFMLADEPVANLEGKMKVAAAFLLDPAFGPAMNPVLREAAELTYRMTDATPGLKAASAVMEAISPDSPTNLPPKSVLQAIDNMRARAVLRSVLTTGAVDVTLVGDLDEKAAIELVAQSFGALPPRPPELPKKADAYFMRYPAQSPPPIHVRHSGPADKAAGSLIWPLYVATPERRREEFAIRVLASIFNSELRHELRGELGKTYAPSVVSQMPDYADQGVLVAQFESYPGDADALVAATLTVARRLADGGITDAQLTTARAAMLVTNKQDMATNLRWASAISYSSVNDQNLRDVLGYENAIATMRLDEVRKVAADWLKRDPVIVTATSAEQVRTGGAP